MDINENMDNAPQGAFGEQNDATRLANSSRVTPYRVPDQYFNDLQSRINNAIFLAELGQQTTQGFKVPENYFEDLGSRIENRIAMEKLRSLATTDGFSTPPHYFEQLQANILSKTSGAERRPKIFRLWQSEAMRYISAACFIAVVASGLYMNQRYKVQENTQTELASDHLLYDIDESVILEHLEESKAANNNAPSETETENYILDNFSSTELSNSL